MEKYKIGPDEFSDWDWKNILEEEYEWFVYWYEASGYEGSGVAITKCKSGGYDLFGLGHCSSFGPLEDGPIHLNDVASVQAMCLLDEGLPNRPRNPEDYDHERYHKLWMWLRNRSEFVGLPDITNF